MKQSKQSERVSLHTVEFVAQIYRDGDYSITMNRVRAESSWIYLTTALDGSRPIEIAKIVVPDAPEQR